MFEVVLRELSAQAAPQTRTYRARLKPATPRQLPLGGTTTLVAERDLTGPPLAVLPAAAITQSDGQPALWITHRDGVESYGTVELVRVEVHGYRSDKVLVSGPPAGTFVVTAGVQKMAPGLRVALPGAANEALREPEYAMKSFNLTEWALNHRAVVLFLLIAVAVGGTVQLRQARPARRSRTSRSRR